jgi:hypothetical protein
MRTDSLFVIIRQACVVQNACKGKMTNGKCKNKKIGKKRGFGLVRPFKKLWRLVLFIITTLLCKGNEFSI